MASRIRVGIATQQQSAQVSQKAPTAPLLGLLQGTLGKLACKCSANDNADFLIKKDRIVCAACGNQVLCTPPLLGVFTASCNCCASSSIKSTFILDSRGIYTCSWCGVSR